MKPHGIWVNCEACGEELKVTHVESVEDEWGRPLGVEVTVEWHECVKEDGDEV